MRALTDGVSWLLSAVKKGVKKKKRSAGVREAAAFALYELCEVVDDFEKALWTAASHLPPLPDDWLESTSAEGGFTDPRRVYRMTGDDHVDYYVFTISGLSWYYGCHVDGEWAYWRSCASYRAGQVAVYHDDGQPALKLLARGSYKAAEFRNILRPYCRPNEVVAPETVTVGLTPFFEQAIPREPLILAGECKPENYVEPEPEAPIRSAGHIMDDPS